MPLASASILVSGNCHQLINEIINTDIDKTRFVSHHVLQQSKYQLHLIDVNESLENASQDLINIYSRSVTGNTKLIVCLIFDKEILREKVFHFQKLLSELGKDKTIHRLVVTKDLYQDNHLQPITSLDKDISKVLSSDSVNISVKGNNHLYPLNLLDFLIAIQKIFFLNTTSGKTFYLLGEEVTDLDLAYTIKKILEDDKPNFQINSISDNLPLDSESKNISLQTQIDLNWRPQVDFENSIRKIYHQILPEKDYMDPLSVDKKTRSSLLSYLNFLKTRLKFKGSSKNSTKPAIFGIILVILTLYLLNAVIFFSLVFQSLKYLTDSLNYLREGNIEQSVYFVNKSSTYRDLSFTLYWPIRPLLEIVSPSSNTEIYNTINLTHYLQNALENLQQTYVLSEKTYLSLNGTGANVNLIDQSLALKTSLSQVYENLNQINIFVNSSKLPSQIYQKIVNDENYKRLSLIEEQLYQSIRIVNMLPSIGGPNIKRNTAILVQDQDELRTVGGVVKYVIIVSVDNQKISDIKILDQNEIDKTSDGEVKAPDLVASITGNHNWKLRDMTYFGDFSQTSEYLSWYLRKITGEEVNNVISINKTFFESLINQSQGIEVSGNKISSDKLQNVIGEPDSNVLRQVIDYFITKYRENKLSLSVIGRTITDEINNGRLYVWTDDQSLESSIANQPFSGVITPYHCHSSLANYDTCINQTTYLSESNFTIAPVNPFIKRDVVHKVSLSQNNALHEYQLNYHYLADLSILNRDYRLIYQIYSPSGSKMESVEIDGQFLDTSGFIHQKYGQFEYIQFPLALSIDKDHIVKIKFSSPLVINSDITQTAYSLTEIRQPGIRDQGFGLIIDLPENTHANLVSAPVDTKPSQVIYRFPPRTTTFGLGLGLSK